MAEPARGITVLIPAYNPDEKLLALLPRLRERFARIVLVDDGSTEGRDIFPRAAPYVEKILVHPRNRGKGAALKTGFAYLRDSGTDVITADADGQHTPEDIAKVAEGLAHRRRGLVLGVRSFTGKVPFRSRFGNWWTRWFFFLMTGGLLIRDTQTGLRGIPAEMLARVAAIPGERYEYEMAMLADAKHHEERPLQIPIETIYIAANATSHFNPLLDTVRIYRRLLQFCLSSILSFALDYAVFIGLLAYLGGRENELSPHEELLLSTVVARFISSNFNYFYNRFVVFRTKGRKRSFFQYFGLVVVIWALSYGLTDGLCTLLRIRGLSMTLIKVAVDVFLFLTSYWVQKRFIFRSRAD